MPAYTRILACIIIEGIRINKVKLTKYSTRGYGMTKIGLSTKGPSQWFTTLHVFVACSKCGAFSAQEVVTGVHHSVDDVVVVVGDDPSVTMLDGWL